MKQKGKHFRRITKFSDSRTNSSAYAACKDLLSESGNSDLKSFINQNPKVVSAISRLIPYFRTTFFPPNSKAPRQFLLQKVQILDESSARVFASVTMGALTNNRKRGEETFVSFPNFSELSYGHIAKKLKFSDSMYQKTPDCNRTPPYSSVVSRISRYPVAKKSGFPREVLGPVRNINFGRSSFVKGTDSCRASQVDAMGKFGFFNRMYEGAKKSALKTLKHVFHGKQKDKEVVEINSEDENQGDDSSIEEVENLNSVWRENQENTRGKKEEWTLVSSVVSDVRNDIAKVDGGEKALLSLLDQEPHDSELPVFKRLWLDSEKGDDKRANLRFDIEIHEKRLQGYPQKKEVLVKKDVAKECFLSLTEDEIKLVSHNLSNANRRKIVVSHERSNIDITGEKLQCLRDGAWLNDEVINLYLELLKERERREPKKFLNCHFFNTFFYKKLISGGYNFSSVRRWTTQRKLGYSLLECDKIFVPIHKQVHWCLAIINKKEEKFQYLDSLGGTDGLVLNVLARYFVDEVKDKCGKDIDVDSWEREFVTELPEQENGYDCGMFMIKYADFYSRGIGLCFCQDDMQYFRKRTAKEILKLRAE